MTTSTIEQTATSSTKPVTGIRQIAMSESEQQFRIVYLAELRVEAHRLGRKLTQCERIAVFMQIQKTAGATFTSKRVITVCELAAYHGWPIFMCKLHEGCTKYSYNQGRITDRDYRDIDPDVTAWINA